MGSHHQIDGAFSQLSHNLLLLFNIRPTIIASEPFLGVRPAKSYIYFVILSPVGAYYPEGMNRNNFV